MYDIFISFKCLDKDGGQTPDARLAAQLYEQLVREGYSVFFSMRSLEDEGSFAFKNRIDEALDSAKVLIVVLTKGEYAYSKWVQYEWNSFYNDYLSDVKSDAHLFTFVDGVPTSELPRTLRNVQSFQAGSDTGRLLNYLKSVFNRSAPKYRVKEAEEVTFEDVKQAVQLDSIVYAGMEHVDPEECWRWFTLNPDIYTFIEETERHRIIAYTNTAPVTDECYDLIKSGTFLTTDITEDMLLGFEMPYFYSLYFFSIVISPEYQNTEVFNIMLHAIVDKFLRLGKHEAYVKRMIADAVTPKGERFCRMFGMKKVTDSQHDSKLYEISMIPPDFKPISAKVKELYEFYAGIYRKNRWLFDEEI